MNTILLYGFSESERFFCKERFMMLFPHASFSERNAVDDVHAEEFNAAVIHCRYNGWEAMETVRRFTGKNKKTVLFSQRTPDAILLERVWREADENPELVYLLLCPESPADIAGCAEGVSGKKNGFISAAALRMKKNCSLTRFLDTSAMTMTDLGIVHGMLAGRMEKEMAAALEKSQHYIENRMAVLRERYEILRTPEKLQALLGWLGE
jgi:hypothetical protein